MYRVLYTSMRERHTISDTPPEAGVLEYSMAGEQRDKRVCSQIELEITDVHGEATVEPEGTSFMSLERR